MLKSDTSKYEKQFSVPRKAKIKWKATYRENVFPVYLKIRIKSHEI